MDWGEVIRRLRGVCEMIGGHFISGSERPEDISTPFVGCSVPFGEIIIDRDEQLITLVYAQDKTRYIRNEFSGIRPEEIQDIAPIDHGGEPIMFIRSDKVDILLSKKGYTTIARYRL